MWTGAILAGGRATWLGGIDKSGLMVCPPSILERQLGLLRTLTSHIMIVTSNRTSCREEADRGVGADVAVPRDARRRHPLCASYQRGVAAHLRSRINAGALRLTNALDGLAVEEIEPYELSALDPSGQHLFNINSPDDYARALASAR